MSGALRPFFCAAAWLGLLAAPAAAQVAPYKIAEADLAIDGLSAEVEGANPVVPKNIPSGLRVVVRAGGRALSAEETGLFLGAGFEVRAELAGPGLRQALSLPVPDQPPSDDPLLMRLPGLTVAGDYTISGLRIASGSRRLLDVAPRQLALRVIEQVLITSVQARPLTMTEIQDKGILVDSDSYLGFEFTIALLLDSHPVHVQLPVVFNREGVPMPPTIPLPPAIQRQGVPAPSLIPVLLGGWDDPPPGGDGGGGGGGGGGDIGGGGIPSLLVIPGQVGYLKQHFSAQLFVANGAPAGSPLTVSGVSGTIHLPPGADGVAGTADDPLVLAPLVAGTPSATLPVLGVGPDGQPGTADDLAELPPGVLGQAEFLLRGEREGFHNLSFDVAAMLHGLPTGPVPVSGHAKGGVLVRNAMFDMTFIVPNVVRVYERFTLRASITNIGRGDANDLRVTIDRSRMSGLRLRCPDDRPCEDADATRTIPTLAAGDSRMVEFEFESQRTGQVVASYLHFDTGGTGRLNFTVGMAERGVPLSPDTLVLPTSLDGLPPEVVAAATRVLGQAWSNATAPRGSLRFSVLRIEEAAAKRKMVALSEAGLRVQLGQPAADAVRDLAFDFWGGAPLDAGFDQLLRETEAGRNLAFRIGHVLAGPAGAAGGPDDYERAVSEIAAAGSDFVAVSVSGAAGPVGATLSDAAGRQTVLGRSQADGDLPLSEIPGAAFLALGAPATAPSLGIVTAPTMSPYTLQVTGPAELSVTFPRGDGRFQRGTVTTSHPARVVMDFAAPQSVVAEEDRDGDGTFETRQALSLETLTSQGPRLVSATIVGPETVAGASVSGVHAALLFDRVVGEESAAEKSRFQIPSNRALSAKRQLSGRLVFLGLDQPEGPYVPTTVSISGLADTRGVVGPAGTVPLTSRLREIGAVVSGRVVNADGTPFTGGPVFYSQYNTNHTCRMPGVFLQVVAALRPSSDGRYQFRYVPRDPCGFPFQMAIYDPLNAGERAVQLYVRTAGEQMVADLALMGRGTVAGLVRDAAGNAAGGARVVAVSVTDARVGGQAVTDGDGRYEVRNILVGGVNVRAGRGIYVGQAAGRIDRAGGTATVNVRLEGGSARLSGRVFRLENGVTTPAPGLHVLYTLTSEDALLGVARTDGTGRYVLEGMPAGNFALEASLYAGVGARVTGHADEGQVMENLDLVIVVPAETQLGSVRGTVRFGNGQSAPDVVVRVGERAVLTAGNGSYWITGIPLPSNPTVLAQSRDGMRSGVAHAFLTTANPNPTGIDITLSGVGTAIFTVLDPAGQPIQGQSVSIDGTCGNPCGCTTRATDAQGVARFEGIRLGMVTARALRRFEGVQDVAGTGANLERDDQVVSRVLRFGGVGTVRGVVRDQGTGNPIHGATVFLKANFYDSQACGLKFDYSARMDSRPDGSFDFSGVNAGRALAVATQAFYGASGSATGTVAHGQPLVLDISLRNTMAGGLSGTVFLPDGVTSAGAGVEVTVNGVLPDVTVTTYDAQGHYEFAPILPQGYYTMTVHDPNTGGVAQKRIYLRAQQDAVHDVRLLGRGTVEVTVADGGDQVVDSANVRLRQTEYPFRTYDGIVQPATGGVVRFDVVFEGPFTVEASDAFGRGGRAPGQLAGPDQTVSVRVRLTVTGSVRGRFLMPDGMPIPYGTVRLTTGGRAVGQVTTEGSGEVGSFGFDYVPAGLVRLDAEDPATARTGLAVGTIETEDQELVLDVRAQALGTVRGLVTGDGTPQPGALVEISSGTYRVSTAADSEGWYEVPGVPEGRIAVTASLQGGYLRSTESATLAGEGSTLQVDVALRPSGAVQGAVVEANGTTPARAAVSVSTSGAYFTHHTTEHGLFDFTRVAAGSGWLIADELASIDYVRDPVQVPAGGTVEVTLRLHGVGSLRGTARASDGSATGGYLMLTGGTPAYPWSFSVYLGPDGLFYLPEVLAGPFTATLRVQPSGGLALYGTASATIQPDQETALVVQVQASGTVTGVVRRAGGTVPAFGATVALLHEKGTVYTQVPSDGRFTFRGVPLGAFTLTVHDEVTTGRAKVRNQQVASNGQTVDLGTIELDATPPSLTVVEPADGSSRPPLGGTVVVDVTDAQTGIDTSSFRVVYAGGGQQTTGFTFADGRFTGSLNRDWQVIGPNTLRFEVQDLAGNLTQRTVTYTATGSTLQGVVRMANGSPAPGVHVFVGIGATIPVVTDAAGAYVKGGLRPAGYWLWAVDPATGISTGYDTLTIFDGETRQRDLIFPAFGWIGGVVRHADGSPAPGAIVSYGQRSTTAGAGGVFNLGAFNLGTYHLTASEPARGDRGAVQVTLSQPGQTVTTEIRLNGVGTVTAIVRNADGTPVNGALARAWSSSALGWYGAEQTTPANGTTSWSQALAGTITVLARDPVRNLAGQASGLLNDNGSLSLTVTLEPAGSVVGTVYRAGGTSPAANVNVVINGAASRTVQTDLQGHYSIADVRLSAFQLVATDPASGDTGRASGVVSSASPPVTANITLNGVGNVHVTVRKTSGDPAAGAAVTIGTSADIYKTYTGTSGADGTVSLNNVLAGTLTARADLPSSYGSGQATASLAPGQSVQVTITLEPVATIRGHVFAPDAVTTIPGVVLRAFLNQRPIYSTSAADGSYEFPELPLGNGYQVAALVSGRVRAQSPFLALSSQGQVLVQDLVLVGVGTVGGVVTDPAGAPATGADVRLQIWRGPYAGSFGTTSGAGGTYSLADVPVGPFTITATRGTQNVDQAAAISQHGEALTLNLQLLANSVTLPYGLTDGNLMTWALQTDGGLNGCGWAIGSAERALKLSLIEDGTTRTFAGAGTSAASEHEKREIVVRQAGLGGLDVTRKTFVSATGYFSRSLEMLENQGSAPVTVDVVLESQFGSAPYYVPLVADSTDGNTTAAAEDDWIVVDDAVTLDVYTAPTGQFPPVGIVLSGPGALRPTLVSWDGANRRLTTRWNGVTIVPGQKAGFLTLMTPQADRARARASAQRLTQMPPEALFGLTPEEAAAVRNVLVPVDLASALEALPPNDGVISGKLLAGDGQTPAPGRVTVRSRSPHYGRPIDSGYDAGPDGSFEISSDLTPGYVRLIPRTDLDLTTTRAIFGGQTATAHGRFAESGIRNLSDVTGRSIVVSSQAGDAYAAAANAVDGRLSTHWRVAWGDTAEPPSPTYPHFEIVLPDDATIHQVRVRCSLQAASHVIRRARIDVKAAGGAVLRSVERDIPVDLCAVDVPLEPVVEGARSVRITSLADGRQPTIAELEIMGTGPFSPSRLAQQDLLFTGRGVLEGRLLRSDQTPIVGGHVTASFGSQSAIVDSNASGFYRLPVVPPGSYTVRAELPLRDHSVTVENVPVAADQKTTQDIVFVDLGRLRGGAFTGGGSPIAVSTSLTRTGFSRNVWGSTYDFADVPPGSYTLTATDTRTQGQVSLPVTITANATTTQDVTFPPVGTVNVTVTVDGNPLYYALVEWKSAARPAWGGWVRTNGAGQATMTNVMGPSFTVRATHPDNANAFGEAAGTIPSEAASVQVAVDVPGLGTVNGTVRALNGVVEPSALVRILRAADNAQLAQTTATAAGQFSFSNIPEVPIRLQSSFYASYGYGMVNRGEVLAAVTADGQILALDALVPRGALTASRSADLWEYTLAAGQDGGALAIGMALGADAALADPRLEVYGPGGTLVASNDDRTTADKNAEVAFNAPQAGNYVAAVRGAATGAYRLGVWAGGTNNERGFRRYAGVTVTGHVGREGSGTPVAGAALRLSAVQPGGLSLTASATSLPDGSYRFESVPANASVTVEVIEGGAVVGQAIGTSGAAGTTLDLPLTRLALGPVEVRTIYRGAAFAGASVEVFSSHPSAPESLTRQTGTTGADGRKVFTVVPAGTITAHATDPISGGTVEATGTLTDGGTLALELVFTDGGDTTPPGTIDDLAASAPNVGVVRLTWTAPGDDGMAGTAAAYALRYSTTPIDADNFGAAIVAPTPTPAEAGATQTFDLAGLAPNTTYYLALKARDEAHNWSAISNVVQASTTSLPAGGLRLWLKADVGVGLVGSTSYLSSWQDQSGQNNHAAQGTASAQPMLVPGQVNGLPVIRFDGNSDWLPFTTRITNVRTVFWVIRQDPAATPGWRYLLGDSGGYPFCSGASHQIWHNGYTAAHVRNGETRVNGSLVDGLTTNRPTIPAVISLVTAGDVAASNFTRDPSATGWWWGDLAELILYDRPLSDAERVSIEGYLARKYALYPPVLPAPTVSPNGGTLSTTATVTVAAGLGAEIRYTLDGSEPTASSPLYTEPLAVSGRTTLKAKAFASGWTPSPVVTVTFLAQGDFTPASVSGLKLWVRADAGVSGNAAMRADRWADQSGSANDLTQSDLFARPLLLPNAGAGLPALSFDGANDWLSFASRITNARTVFWVVRENPAAPAGYRYLLGDSTGYPWCSGGSRQIWSGYASANVQTGQTRVNGAAVNGMTTNRPTTLSVISLVAAGEVPVASFTRDMATTSYGFWSGELAELAVYDTALSDTDRRAVEEYLAARYGIVLP